MNIRDYLSRQNFSFTDLKEYIEWIVSKNKHFLFDAENIQAKTYDAVVQ